MDQNRMSKFLYQELIKNNVSTISHQNIEFED